MFEELLKQWAKDQGFDGWSQDHAAVLRNLAKWLNMHAAQQSEQPTCSTCGAKLRSGDIWWNECENCHSKIASG